MKDFIKRNKDLIMFIYLSLITIIAIILAIYSYVISVIAKDLANVVDTKEKEIDYIEKVNKDLNSYNDEIYNRYIECREKLEGVN